MITNNDIMKKLRVALKLRDTDIVAILKLADFEISETELSAFFRQEEDSRYRPCGDQILRRFLDGLIIHHRGVREKSEKQQTGRAPTKNFRKSRHGQDQGFRKTDTVRVYRSEAATPMLPVTPLVRPSKSEKPGLA